MNDAGNAGIANHTKLPVPDAPAFGNRLGELPEGVPPTNVQPAGRVSSTARAVTFSMSPPSSIVTVNVNWVVPGMNHPLPSNPVVVLVRAIVVAPNALADKPATTTATAKNATCTFSN